MRSLNYGGGVQSTALLVLAAQGAIDVDLAIFANTGDDSEDPGTIEYMAQVARPFAAQHGIDLVEVTATIGGEPDTILGKINRTKRSEVIPVRSREQGVPLSRSCTVSFKLEVIGKELRRRGAGPDNPATVMLGISADESSRSGRAAKEWERLAYPLLGLGCDLPRGWDRPIMRSDCEVIVRDAGLPVPPKSSCWFCPFTSVERWRERKRTRPDLFERACQLEAQISEKARKPRYLTRFGRPLAEVVQDEQLVLDLDSELDSCTGGMCAT